jgi:hypothetical protein
MLGGPSGGLTTVSLFLARKREMVVSDFRREKASKGWPPFENLLYVPLRYVL